jgi:cell division septation protein DedD
VNAAPFHSSSMRRLACLTILAFGALGAPRAIHAQASGTSGVRPPATDSIFQRARRLVGEGSGAEGRALVDSMLGAATEGTAAYGDALYWRGALAETAADAEQDYRRVIVEYPLSAYADEALLSLAELEQARGDRAAAFQHLQRFVREHPASPARARAGLAAARLAFEQRDTGHGCAMLGEARASVSSADVELRNQIDYYGSRCTAAQASAPRAPVPTTVTQAASKPAREEPATERPTAEKPSALKAATQQPERSKPDDATPIDAPRSPAATTTSASKAKAAAPKTPASEPSQSGPTAAQAEDDGARRGIWTIQLAAYNTRQDAERLVRKLAARDVKARISGTSKPFRVRLDYYPTRQAAAAVVAALKRRGIIGFVTDEPRAAGAPRP